MSGEEAHLMDRAEVARALSVLAADGLQAGETFELRILGAYPLSGRFVSVEAAVDALAAHARAVEVWAGGQHGGMAGAYFTPNPLKLPPSNDLARGGSATDGDTARRRWFLLDVDPVRPKVDDGTGKLSKACATDAEKGQAWAVRERILTRLCGALGWPRPVLCDSGNGYHALWALNLPPVSDLPKRALAALAAEFDTDGATVDLSVWNPSRIWKLPGTLAIKGPNLPDRPWRRARLEDVPERIQRVTREQLEALAPVEASRAPDLIGSNERGSPFALIGAGRLNAAYSDLTSARAAYRRDRTPTDWPNRPGRCPVHDNDGCFKAATGTNGERWICFSTNHPKTCGKPAGSGGIGGDIIDIDRYLTGKSEAELLREAGYLGDRAPLDARDSARALNEPHTGNVGALEDAIQAPAAPPPGAPGAPVEASTKSAAPPPGGAPAAARPFEPPPGLNRHRFSADPDHKPKPREWLLVDADGNGTIPAGEVGLLIAAGGTGKTMALVQLAATVAGCAVPWLGTATEGAKAKDGWRLAERPEGGEAFGRVLLVMAEEDFDEMDRRRHRFLWAAAGGDRSRYGTLAGAFAARVVPYPLAGVQCALTGAADKNSPEQPTLWSTAFRSMLIEDAAVNGPWRLIILDPATRFMGPDGETDNKAATEWTREVARLALDLPGRPTVVVAHHKNKGATREGSQEQTGARGSSALTDGARFQLDLARDGDGVLALVLAKGNYSKAATKLRLVFDDAGYLRPITKDELDRIALDKATERELSKRVQGATDAKAEKAAAARAREMGLPVDEEEEPRPNNKGGKRVAPKAPKKSPTKGGGRVRQHG